MMILTSSSSGKSSSESVCEAAVSVGVASSSRAAAPSRAAARALLRSRGGMAAVERARCARALQQPLRTLLRTLLRWQGDASGAQRAVASKLGVLQRPRRAGFRRDRNARRLRTTRNGLVDKARGRWRARRAPAGGARLVAQKLDSTIPARCYSAPCACAGAVNSSPAARSGSGRASVRCAPQRHRAAHARHNACVVRSRGGCGADGAPAAAEAAHRAHRGALAWRAPREPRPRWATASARVVHSGV
jgi:hypothetical protein